MAVVPYAAVVTVVAGRLLRAAAVTVLRRLGVAAVPRRLTTGLRVADCN